MLEDVSIIENSVCKSCYHRISRLIIPPDYYWEELGEEPEDVEDGEAQVIEHNYCNELLIPIDHVVLRCNRYVELEESVLIKNEQMLGS